MQKRTDFPSKNEFSISRVSFQMTCWMMMSMMNRQNYCRLERKKVDHKRHHTTKNNRFNITDIFVQSDEMRFRSPSQRRQLSTWMRIIFSVNVFPQYIHFSSALFSFVIVVLFFAFCFMINYKMKMFVRKLI